MAIVKTPALVVRRLDFSETSQVVTFLSPDKGRIECVAKGSRARWAKLSQRPRIEGPLDTLTLNRIVYYEKRGEALDILSECELLYTFAEARRDLPRWHAAVAVQELSWLGTRPESTDAAMFRAAVRAMSELCGEADPRLVLLDFFARWLVSQGRGPDMAACAATGRDLTMDLPVTVSIREGLAYSKGTAPPVLPGGQVELHLDHVLVLRKFLAGVKKPLERVWLPDEILLPIVQLLQGMIVEGLERQPLSLRFLRWSDARGRSGRTPRGVPT